MSQHSAPDFEKVTQEIADAISTLRRHGMQINLPEDLRKRFDNLILFDGDDGLFKSLLPTVANYFEYGCGKSTEYVYKCSKANIYTVDTSEEWARRIQGISGEVSNARLNVKWVDVGKVADWGNPTSFEKRANFSLYTDWVWTQGVTPDLVVIDGRFRVCCFLTSIKYAPIGTKIIFDDYAERPFYHVAEEFLNIIERCGRQALFQVTSRAKSLITDATISEFRNVID
jgi:hypothetical protein